MASLWVATLHISDATARKITHKHKIEPDDVRAAVICKSGLRYVWDEHEERGRRAIVETRINGERVLVVLYPALDPLGDAWHLGSAYPTE